MIRSNTYDNFSSWVARCISVLARSDCPRLPSDCVNALIAARWSGSNRTDSAKHLAAASGCPCPHRVQATVPCAAWTQTSAPFVASLHLQPTWQWLHRYLLNPGCDRKVQSPHRIVPDETLTRRPSTIALVCPAASPTTLYRSKELPHDYHDERLLSLRSRSGRCEPFPAAQSKGTR